jgi:hypothetical protein
MKHKYIILSLVLLLALFVTGVVLAAVSDNAEEPKTSILVLKRREIEYETEIMGHYQ